MTKASGIRRIAAMLVGVVGIGVIVFTVMAASVECEVLGDHFWEISPSAERSLEWSAWTSTNPVETPTGRPNLTEVRQAQVKTVFSVYTIHQARDPFRPDDRYMCPLMNSKEPRVGAMVGAMGGEFIITGLLVLVLWGRVKGESV